MAIYINHRNPTSAEMDKQILELEKVPGVCLFIDLINSTGDKYRDDRNTWIKKVNNTFNFISVINQFPNYVVKGIGDEMMLYLPDCELKTNHAFDDYLSLLSEIYATMDTLIHHPLKELFYECKVGIHYCTDVYNITFFEGVNDYYGKDIDSAARLMQKARGNRIVMSEAFYRKVLEDVKHKNLDPADTVISQASQIYIEDFKGVPEPFEFRVVRLR
ncbi:MAG: adenylate/guanylate cyclase domain-containing protein [Bacteroidales bacterium]